MIPLLALAAATVPMSVEFLLPAIPQLGTGTLTAFVLGLAFGHLLLGQVSDRFGRRRVLLSSFAVFAVSAFASAIVPAFDLPLRFIQGCASAGLLLVSKAVPRDMFDGPHATAKMSRISTFSFLVMLAGPAFGAYLLQLGGIALVHTAIGSVATLAFFVAALVFQETLKSKRRIMWSNYGVVLGNIGAMRCILANSFLAAGMFAFISGSPRMIMTVYCADRHMLGFVYALCMAPLMLGSYLNSEISVTTGPSDRIKLGSATILLSALVYSFSYSQILGLYTFVIASALYTFGCGILYPNSQSAALSHLPSNLGVGAGLIGAFAYLGSSISSGIQTLALPIISPALTAVFGVIGVACLLVGKSRFLLPIKF